MSGSVRDSDWPALAALEGALGADAAQAAAGDRAVASWLAVRIELGAKPCRRPLPDPDVIRDIASAWRSLIFPEFWTDSAPSEASLAEQARALRAMVVQQVVVERLSRPDKDGPAATGAPSADECEAALASARAIGDAVIDAVPAVREALDADLQAALDGDPAAQSRAEIVLCYPGFHAIETWRLAHILWQAGATLIARILTEQAHARSGIDLHPGASIAPGLFIDHGTGVVVGETAVIGAGVRLYQGVTVGARSLGRGARAGKRHPTLEDGVVVYANATILGGDTIIGRGAVVGGNAWVTSSVPPGGRLRMGDDDDPARGGPAG
jgi:serine O-acetyltransferase